MNILHTLDALCQTAVSMRTGVALWRPVLDPLPVDTYWLWLMLPLVVGVAVVYKALKVNDLAKLPSQALTLVVQLVVLMAVAAAVLWLLTELV